jgi:hypothetical protein
MLLQKQWMEMKGVEELIRLHEIPKQLVMQRGFV